jgi:translation initiation factor IF-3
LRVIGPQGENFGVIPLQEALRKAEEFSLDLIEISAGATPPVAKIGDYGKYLYEASKKARAARAKAHTIEVKNIQVKVGTGEHDLALKARKVSEWIREGNRVKIDLFLPGLQERMDRILKLVTEEYKVADPAKKSPKGLTIIIEKGK